MGELAPIEFDGRYLRAPHCLRCDKPVDSVFFPDGGQPIGEMTLTVSCHGESWSTTVRVGTSGEALSGGGEK